VLALLTLAALTFSYLGAYAVAGALVDSDVLAHWPPGHDPRPRWMACLFGMLLGASFLVSAIARFLSRRQLSRIDAMAEE
jgi:ABC-type branched-subunit amino acid transport system permease subunit